MSANIEDYALVGASAFAFSSTQYGALFVPRFVLTIAASTLAPWLALRPRAGQFVAVRRRSTDLRCARNLYADAPLALTSFWVAVTVGRVFIAFLDRVVPAMDLQRSSVLLAAALQLVARSASMAAGLTAVAAAG